MILTHFLTSLLTYVVLILIFSAFWGGSVIEYRMAKHKISIQALETFAQKLPFSLKTFYSPQSSFNYWTNKSNIDPFTQLRSLNVRHARRIMRRTAAVVAVGVLLPFRELALDLSWASAFWAILSVGTVYFLRAWRFGESLPDIDAHLKQQAAPIYSDLLTDARQQQVA